MFRAARNLHAPPYSTLFPRLYVASRRARAVRAKCSLAGLTSGTRMRHSKMKIAALRHSRHQLAALTCGTLK